MPPIAKKHLPFDAWPDEDAPCVRSHSKMAIPSLKRAERRRCPPPRGSVFERLMRGF